MEDRAVVETLPRVLQEVLYRQRRALRVELNDDVAGAGFDSDARCLGPAGVRHAQARQQCSASTDRDIGSRFSFEVSSQATPARLPAGTSKQLRAGNCRRQGVLQQRRHGHRPDSPRHRRDPCGSFARRREDHVTDQLAVRKPGDADVQDDRPGLDPLAWNEPRLAHGDGEDVGVCHVVRAGSG